MLVLSLMNPLMLSFQSLYSFSIPKNPARSCPLTLNTIQPNEEGFGGVRLTVGLKMFEDERYDYGGSVIFEYLRHGVLHLPNLC